MKANFYTWLAHDTAAKILSTLYADSKIGNYIDEEWNDEVVKQVEEGIKEIIDFHVSKSRQINHTKWGNHQ